jgi:hypothetical protein
VLAAVAPKLIEVGVDTIAGVLTKAGERHDKTVTALANGYFYASDGQGTVRSHAGWGCVVVVHGRFGSAGGPVQFSDPSKAEKFKDLGLVDDPNFYLEANVEYSAEGSAFELKPKILLFGKAIEDSWFSKERDLVVTVAFRRGLDATEKPAFGSTQFLFENVRENTAVEGSALQYKGGAWVPMHPLDDKLKEQLAADREWISDKANLEALEKHSEDFSKRLATKPPGDTPLTQASVQQLCALAAKHDTKEAECPQDLVAARREVAGLRSAEAQLLDLKKRIDDLKAKIAGKGLPKQQFELAPMTVQATITETREGNEYLHFAGKVLSAAKDDLKTGLKQELIPAEREKAREKEEADRKQKQAAQDALDLKALEALQAVETAEVALANAAADLAATERKKLELAVQLAKMKANIAYKAAGRNEPYSGIF